MWEPVIATDIAPPTTSVLALLHDPRAEQFWDHDRSLSAELVRSALANPERYKIREEIHAGSVIWDTVALFPPGALWDQDVPVPVYYGEPVLRSIDGLKQAMTKLHLVP